MWFETAYSHDYAREMKPDASNAIFLQKKHPIAPVKHILYE